MKSIKAIKTAKQNRKAKDLHDIKTRGYTDSQYESLKICMKDLQTSSDLIRLVVVDDLYQITTQST